MKTTWGYRAVVIMAVLLLSATMAHAQGTQLLVSNVQVQQRQFSALVDVTYDLETVDSLPVWVRLFFSTDGGVTYSRLCRAVTGDAGANVQPGASRHILWNAGADFPGIGSAGCRVLVTVDDADNQNDFAYVDPGTFMMGSPANEPLRSGNETQHQVTLTHGICVQTTEVTNRQYMELAQWAYDHGYVTVDGAYLRDNLDGSTLILRVLNSATEMTFNGGIFSCVNPTHPVMAVTWYGAVAYCDWLSLRQGLPRAYIHANYWQCNGGNPYTAVGYRLPTDAEWEYACRAGTQTPFNTGFCLDAGTEANYYGGIPYYGCPSGLYVAWTVPVASYPPNAFGLYDLHGNVSEWCNDYWGGSSAEAVVDPVGPAGNWKVIRSGYYNHRATYCRSAYRYSGDPASTSTSVGFRPVRSAW